ncbi:MAG: glycosyltransferase [Deltaproteobacteria bacterium]|jgi:hypothetical protein|nr:glycosyltransferase [Deltaproteobacteria bacterium]MBT6489756.1 glycosyltransferase [Deltaproteobacteria bacterium]
MGSDSRSHWEIWQDTRRLALDGVLPPFSLPRRALGFARKTLLGGRGSQNADSWIHLVSSTRRPRIAVVSGCGGDSRRYRCEHLLETLQILGGDGIILEAQQSLPADAANMLSNLEGIVFHRAAWSPQIQALVESAKKLKKFLIFDTDDLVFDVQEDPSQDKGVGRFGKGQAVAEQFKTMQACQMVMTSTDFLKSRVESLGLSATTLRNGFSSQMLQSAEATRMRRSKEQIILGYASGTPTHDRDLQVIEQGLVWTLERYSQVHVHLMGYIRKPHSLSGFGSRVQRRPFVHWSDLPQRLRDIDINLAPFSQDSVFSKGKSALKHMEAALVAVPTIASPMPAYLNAIESGKNGLIAQSDVDWRDHLQLLIENTSARLALGNNAQKTVLERDSLEKRSIVLRDILDSLRLGPEALTSQ